MNPILTICICSIKDRAHFLSALLDKFRQQQNPAATILTDVDDGEVSIGAKRARMLEKVTTEYVCFFDDDDEPSEDYTQSIVDALRDRPDCVGFKLERWVDGKLTGEAVHSLNNLKCENQEQPSGQMLYLRTPNHLNPVHTEVARAVGFRPIDWGEDGDYAKRLQPHLKTEAFIPRVIYKYLYRQQADRQNEITHRRRMGFGAKRNWDILVKWPSRSRPELFAKTFKRYDNGRVRFLVTLDLDDPRLNEYVEFLDGRKNVKLDIGIHNSKIEAFNSGLDSESFDIVMAGQEDMIPHRPDYDIIIGNAFAEQAPDLDGVFYAPDGRRADKLNTNAIMGRTYFKRFGYLWNPHYKSLFADNELTDISRKLGKEVFYPDCIIKHDWVEATGKDELHHRNESFFVRDMMAYCHRRQQGFPCVQASYAIT